MTTTPETLPAEPEPLPAGAEAPGPSTGARSVASASFLTSMLGQYALMQLVIAMTGVVRNKVVAVRLGPSEFGELAQVLALVAVVTTLVTFGMRLSVSRNIAKAGGPAEQQLLLASANGIVLSFSVAGLVVMLGALASGNLLRLIGITPTEEVAVAAALCIAGIPFAALQANYLALLQGVLDVKGLARQRSLAMLVATAVSVPLVWQFGLVGAGAAVLATSVLLAVLLGHRGRSLGFDVLAVHLDRERVRLLASFGLVSVVAGFAGTLADTSVRAALIAQVGPAANGLLQAPLVVASTVQTILLESVGAMALTTVSIAKGREQVTRTVRQLVVVVLPFAISALGLLGLLGVPAMVLLYSPAFVAGASYLPFILVYQLLLVIIWVIGSPLLASGDRMLWLVQDLVWVAVGWALSMALLPAFEATAVVVGALVAAAGQLTMLCLLIAVRYRVTIGARNAVHVVIGIVVVAVVAVIGTTAGGALALYTAGVLIWGGSVVYCLTATPIVAMARARIERR